MKTRTIFLACILLCFGITQLSAQTKAVITRLDLDWALQNPVYCDDSQTEVDRLVMDYFTYFAENLFKDGTLIKTNNRLSGQAHSINTGEIFIYKEVDHSVATGTTYNARFNLIGDQGHHYLQTFVIDNSDAELILHPLVIKAICLEKVKK